MSPTTAKSKVTSCGLALGLRITYVTSQPTILQLVLDNCNAKSYLPWAGQSPDVDSGTAAEAEAFISTLHKVSNRIPTIADEARHLLFCQKAQSNLQLSPASGSLLQHIKRANYQPYLWRKVLVPRQDLPTPAGNG